MLVPIARAALERVKELDRELISLMGFLSWVQELGNERAPRLPESEVGRETRMQRALEAPLAEVRAEIDQHFVARANIDERKAVGLVWAQLRTDLHENPDLPLPTT
jgi:hypothetical protein